MRANIPAIIAGPVLHRKKKIADTKPQTIVPKNSVIPFSRKFSNHNPSNDSIGLKALITTSKSGMHGINPMMVAATNRSFRAAVCIA